MQSNFLDAKTKEIPREGDTEIDLAPAGDDDTVIDYAPTGALEGETDAAPDPTKWRENKTELDTTPPAALSGAMVLSGEIAEPDTAAETDPMVCILVEDEDED